MRLSDKLSAYYDDNAALRDGIAMAMPDFEYPDWSHKSVGELLRAIEPRYAIHIAHSAFDVDDKASDASRVKEYAYIGWVHKNYKGDQLQSALGKLERSEGTVKAYPEAFLNEVEGVHHFNRRAQGIFCDNYIDADCFPVGDTFVYHLRAKLYGRAGRDWTKAQNAALARSMTSDEMAEVMKTGLSAIKEIEVDALKTMGAINITSVGAENIYFRKGGQEYFCKVGFTDQYPEGEVDLNDTAKLSDVDRFNAVALIAIYLHCDQGYKSSAKLALNQLLLHKDPLVVDRYAVTKFLDDGVVGDFASTYNELFEQFVLDKREDWKPFIDYYGAKGFKDALGEIVFSGDDCGMYPYFKSHKALLDRLALHDDDLMGDCSPRSA